MNEVHEFLENDLLGVEKSLHRVAKNDLNDGHSKSWLCVCRMPWYAAATKARMWTSDDLRLVQLCSRREHS